MHVFSVVIFLAAVVDAFLPGTSRARRTPTPLHSTSSPFVREFLGKGPDAVVRNGVVLISPAEEFHHFYRQAAIFIYTMGEAEEGDDYLIRGLILDHPTAFTLGESMPQAPTALSETPIFRGGDRGGEGVVLLHNKADFGGEEVGNSGIYQGGWSGVSDESHLKEDDSKVFFNYCEFTEKEIELMLEMKREDNDSWMSMEVDPSFILDKSYGRGDAWSRLRNAVAQQQPQDTNA